MVMFVLFYCSHVVTEDMEIIFSQNRFCSERKRIQLPKDLKDLMTSHRVHLCNYCRSSGLSQWWYNARPMSGRCVVSRVFFENVLIGFSWIDANKTCSTRHLLTNIFYSEYSSRTSWMITLRTFTYSILYAESLMPIELKDLKDIQVF